MPITKMILCQDTGAIFVDDPFGNRLELMEPLGS